MTNELEELKSKLKHFDSKKEKDLNSDLEIGTDWKRNAFQVSSELLAGVIVGVIIGYVIDYFFGTKPWGLVSLMFLGGVAGIYNVCKNLMK